MSSPFTSSSREPRPAAWAAAVSLFTLALAPGACAQQPVPAPPLASYRPLELALVQPATGGIVPQDRPVVVFRFAPGDSTDPIDARSFAITVDGVDRTSSFQATREMAVGLLVRDSAANSPAFTPGIHQLHARVCSLRGVCTELDASVTVVPPESITQSRSTAEPDSTAEGGSPVSLIRMLLELVLALARKLIRP